MEEKRKLIKKLFSNYLREFYIELTPEEVGWVRAKCTKITESSWTAVMSSQRQIKGLISYYLVSKKHPEYRALTTVELVEHRFDDEETSTIRDLICYQGILILRHSASFIKNKLMFETLMNIVSERTYRNNPVIVISDIMKDVGGYVYYDHNLVIKYIPNNLSGSCSPALSASALNTTSVSSTSNTASIINPVISETEHVQREALTLHRKSPSSRPLINISRNKACLENELKSRSQFIEDSTKNAI
jgi:hypothetical protein